MARGPVHHHERSQFIPHPYSSHAPAYQHNRGQRGGARAGHGDRHRNNHQRRHSPTIRSRPLSRPSPPNSEPYDHALRFPTRIDRYNDFFRPFHDQNTLFVDSAYVRKLLVEFLDRFDTVVSSYRDPDIMDWDPSHYREFLTPSRTGSFARPEVPARSSQEAHPSSSAAVPLATQAPNSFASRDESLQHTSRPSQPMQALNMPQVQAPSTRHGPQAAPIATEPWNGHTMAATNMANSNIMAHNNGYSGDATNVQNAPAQAEQLDFRHYVMPPDRPSQNHVQPQTQAPFQTYVQHASEQGQHYGAPRGVPLETPLNRPANPYAGNGFSGYGMPNAHNGVGSAPSLDNHGLQNGFGMASGHVPQSAQAANNFTLNTQYPPNPTCEPVSDQSEGTLD